MRLLKHSKRRWSVAALAVAALALPLTFAGTAVSSSPTTVPLGTAANFAILAGSGISDVPAPPSKVSGDVGVSPASGATITDTGGTWCAAVTGTIYTVDATGPSCRVANPGLLTTARNDQTVIASPNAAGRLPDATYVDPDNQLGGKTLVAGVYKFAHAATANLIGNLTLNGDADAVWIFQATSDFVTAGSSTVTLTGGAQACNVFWQVPTSATIGGSSTLVGTVLADAGISVLAGATVQGRLLAGTAVTLISDTITKPSTCVTQAQVNAANAAAAQAAAAATAAANAAAAATAAANQAAADAEAARQAAAAKAIADKAAADAATAKAAADKAAAEAAAAAAAAAKAAAARDVAAAKAAAVKAVTAAKVAAVKAATAKKAAARAAAVKKAAHGATSVAAKKTHARPARRSYGFTG
jgi:hypothetical protein